MRRLKVSTAALSVAVLALAGCNWTTYHGNAGRSGVLPGNADATSLKTAWTRGLDGAVYASPIVHAGTIYVATEGGSVYAFNTAGKQLWRKHLANPVPRSALPCGNIDPLGITGTPVYDPATGRVFAVAETQVNSVVQHKLYSLNGRTGAIVGSRLVVPPHGDPIAHQQRGALTLTGGRVLVPFGGLAGDCGPYIGSVVGTRTDLKGAQSKYSIPTTREAGIWTPPGPTVLADGSILIADGNGESLHGYDGSDSVVHLTKDLRFLDRFSPSSWVDDNANDLDLGSMGPAVTSNGFVVQSGKRGVTYVLRLHKLGGIGGQVSSVTGCAAYGGAAVSGNTVFLPCSDGVRRADIGAHGGITLGWQAAGVPGSPVLYGKTLVATSQEQGRLYLLDPATGAKRTSLAVGALSRFATPALDLGRAYVGTMGGIVAVNIK
jgi:outer membrane protein assembly factor BamB